MCVCCINAKALPQKSLIRRAGDSIEITGKCAPKTPSIQKYLLWGLNSVTEPTFGYLESSGTSAFRAGSPKKLKQPKPQTQASEPLSP